MTATTITGDQVRTALRVLDLVPEQVVSVVITCDEVTVKTRAADVTRAIVPDDVLIWTCPLCWISAVGATAPAGWLIVEPFTRVAACAVCRPMFGTPA